MCAQATGTALPHVSPVHNEWSMAVRLDLAFHVNGLRLDKRAMGFNNFAVKQLAVTGVCMA